MVFHPVMKPPSGLMGLKVFDFSRTVPEDEITQQGYGIGRYNEKRPDTYKTPLFENDRNIHMGIDLFAPAGELIYSFADGSVLSFGYNGAEGDYGYTLLLEHTLTLSAGRGKLYALYGHLSKSSVTGKQIGQPIRGGDQIASVGKRDETEGGFHTSTSN